MRNILGKDVYENPSHTTCTGIGYHSDIVPSATIMTVIARHFALMKESGYKNIAVSCVTSFGLYTEILDTWNHFPKELEKKREYIFKDTRIEYDITDKLAHKSYIVFKFKNEIALKAKHKLITAKSGEPLNIVEHIGCHYAKMFPKSGMGGAEFPNVLSGMADAWGGKVVDYPERRHCCGFGFRQYLVQANRGYSVSNTYKKFSSMKPYKPDLVLTNCPGCTMFMDKWQYTIREMDGTTFGNGNESVPVLTYEELAGLVLGLNPWDLGLQYHMVQSEPLLRKLGIEFDSTDKYKTKGGRQMPIPQNLINT
jgi:heterodisulfide reductase subunit B